MSQRLRGEKTDEQLVGMSLEQKEFFAMLVSRYEEKLTRYIKRISMLNQEDIEDILQDVFIKVYVNLNNFDPSMSFSSWIYRITHNMVISTHRKKMTRSAVEVGDIDDETLENIAKDEDLEEMVLRNERIKDLIYALQDINPRYREVLILKFFEGKEYQEISDILQKPVGTVGTLINRAKKQLAQKLEV